MVNTYIIPNEFEYFEPKTIEEAVRLLATYGEKTKVIAGGTDLLFWMKMGKVQPHYLINIARIPALRYMMENNGLHIGTLTSFREVERSRLIQKNYTALFEAARSVTSVQIKHMGTIGGNLCNASPAADSAPPLIAFGGRVKLIGEDHERIFPLEEFFVGNGETVLSPKEILVEIQVTKRSGKTGSAFLKIGRVSADLAKISVAVVIVRQGDICLDCKIVMGAVAKTPLRIKKAEGILIGKRFEEGLIGKVCHQVSEEIQPRSRRSTAWYKKEVAKVMVRDAINLAWRRAEKGVSRDGHSDERKIISKSL